VDEELLKIQEIVNQIKTDTDVKERFMTLQDVIDYEKRDSYIHGFISGFKPFCDDRSEMKKRIKENFNLPDHIAEEYMKKYW